MEKFVKKPCKSCPFRNDVRPFLHPDRAYEIASASENKYNDFPCHNSFEFTDDEDYDGEAIADMSQAKTCAGFLTMRAQSGLKTPDGFNPSWEKCYTDPLEMYYANKEEYEKK
jgi:hypothetical protein